MNDVYNKLALPTLKAVNQDFKQLEADFLSLKAKLTRANTQADDISSILSSFPFLNIDP